MKINTVNLYHYSLPLNQPIPVRGKKYSTRDGIVMELISDHGIHSFGEAAPLPGCSAETIETVLKQLKDAIKFLVSHPLPKHPEKLDGQVDRWLAPLKLSASAHFCIEMGLLNLISNHRRIPLFRLISDHTHDHIRVNGLLEGNLEEVIQQAKGLLALGFRAMKLKVGSGNIHDDIEKVKAVNEALNGQAILHLDANQAWSPDEAIAIGDAISAAAVDYIEEPFADTSEIPHFFNHTLIPVALDESVQQLSFEEIKSIEGVDVIILKPTILGGIEKTWQIAKAARVMAIMPVISSSFESSLTLLTLANISGGWARDTSAGLDTAKWFKKDLLIGGMPLDHGRIDISQQRVEKENINFELLQSVT